MVQKNGQDIDKNIGKAISKIDKPYLEIVLYLHEQLLNQEKQNIEIKSVSILKNFSISSSNIFVNDLSNFYDISYDKKTKSILFNDDYEVKKIIADIKKNIEKIKIALEKNSLEKFGKRVMILFKILKEMYELVKKNSNSFNYGPGTSVRIFGVLYAKELEKLSSCDSDIIRLLAMEATGSNTNKNEIKKGMELSEVLELKKDVNLSFFKELWNDLNKKT